MIPKLTNPAPDQSQLAFENELMELDAATAAGDPGYISQLLVQLTAGLEDPASQTVGDFAQTLQAIQAELRMMAGHFGMPVGTAEVVDWAAILAAADAMAGEEQGPTEWDPALLSSLGPSPYRA
jgi:hypothetical protein